MENNILLDVKGLKTYFHTFKGVVKAVDDVSFSLKEGEILGIVGESGSGKSVTSFSILKLVEEPGVVEAEQILFDGRDLSRASERDMIKIRGKDISMVFQDSMTSLNPTVTIGNQIIEGMLEHYKLTKEEAKARAIKLLEEVGIKNPEKRFKQYPHQLSGGMCQRVGIAIALACDPDILICDEPTTALDVTIQLKILNLIKKIQKEKQISVVYITHDLGVVAKVADYVCVMYAGRIIEKGSVEEIFYDPRHPYTWGLLSSMPDLTTDSPRLFAIPGEPVNLLHEIKGDAFAPRNPYALKIDFEQAPPMFNVGGKHRVASWLCHPKAEKVQMPESLRIKIDRMLKGVG